MNGRVEDARSLLFVPGSRADRFDKALASGADVVVLDLEDAVGPDDKTAARENVRLWLASGQSAVVRVNARGTAWWADDIKAVAGLVGAVMLAKTESADDVEATVAAGAASVLGLVETARGIARADEICRATGLQRVAFGSIDYAVDLGVDPTSRLALAHARSVLVNASAVAGLPSPVEGVTTDLSADGPLADDTGYAKEMGFGGKLCIHPQQVAVVNDGFRASAAEVAWARDLLGHFTGDVGVHDGRMVDAPVVARARAIMAAADDDR